MPGHTQVLKGSQWTLSGSHWSRKTQISWGGLCTDGINLLRIHLLLLVPDSRIHDLHALLEACLCRLEESVLQIDVKALCCCPDLALLWIHSSLASSSLHPRHSLASDCNDWPLLQSLSLNRVSLKESREDTLEKTRWLNQKKSLWWLLMTSWSFQMTSHRSSLSSSSSVLDRQTQLSSLSRTSTEDGSRTRLLESSLEFSKLIGERSKLSLQESSCLKCLTMTSARVTSRA